MRTWLLALVLAGCSNPSKLDVTPGADCDALWDLAPAGTEVGIVASPHALGLVLDALAAANELAKTPDFAPLAPQIDTVTGALFGAPGASPADAGITPRLGFAMFVTAAGVLGIMPVADRDKFVAAKHGTRAAAGSDADDLNGNTCKPIGAHYVCASSPAMFAMLGTGSLRGKPALAGGRGDLELYAPKLPLFGGGAGDLAIVTDVKRGELDVRAKWTGTPGGGLGKLVGVVAPHVDADRASGFVAGNVTALLQGLPPVPIAGGITMDQLAKSFAGPVFAVIPTGSLDIQGHIPLSDPAPAKTVVGDHCKDLGQMLDLVATQPSDACRFRLQTSSTVELETWVDGKELRVGAHRHEPAPGATGSLTAMGRELASGTWTAVFWGRGSMLNLTGITPPTIPMPPEAAAAIHAIAFVDELGGGLVIDKTSMSFRGILRTVWANPPEIAAKLVAFSGDDIVRGAAMEPAKAIAASAPGSQFATDFAAGQGGLMFPGAVLGLASAIVIPALESLLGGGDDGGGGGDDAPLQLDP